MIFIPFKFCDIFIFPTKNNSNISDDSQDYDTVADLINKLLVHQNELEQEIKDLEDKIESLRYRL